jgi:hypothetical protein
MTGTLFAHARWLCLIGAVALGQVAAEPLTSGAGALPAAISTPEPETQAPRAGVIEPPKIGAPGIIDRALVGNEAPTGSKTVELLLEMQGKNPGLAAGERPKADTSPSRPNTPPAPAANTAFGADPASPFGSAEGLRPKAPASGDPEAIDWSEAPASRFGGGGLATGGSLTAGTGAPREPFRPGAQAPRATDEDNVIWLIPRKLIRFVRENRDMVILGSVGLLLLLWGVSSFSAARRK